MKAQFVKIKQAEHTNEQRCMLQKVKHCFLITLGEHSRIARIFTW